MAILSDERMIMVAIAPYNTTGSACRRRTGLSALAAGVLSSPLHS
jgi:hypothetical protein